MFNNLAALALGIIVFAIVIGVGLLVLHRFSGAVAECKLGYTFNYTANTCCMDNATTCTGTVNASTPTNAGYTNTQGMITHLGSSGLAGWTAAIIALAVGLLFIGALMGRKNNY